jgi:hypothetical protein
VEDAARYRRVMGESFDRPVHPLAALFPMMADDELAELADDIKANGLIHPIVLGEWKDERGKRHEGVIDGRNRLRACEMAEVEPTFTHLNGQDPRAYVVSVNLARRNLTKGQQAMLRAMIEPEPKRGTRTDLLKNSTSELGFDKALLSKARTVLRSGPDLVDLVLIGSKSIDAAYDIVRDRVAALTSEEAKMARLRAAVPDIAALVDQQKISVVAAMTEMTEREEQARMLREHGRKAVPRIMQFCGDILNIHSAIEVGEPIVLSKDQAAQITKAMELLRKILDEQEKGR